jgi:hypothetical protein
MQNKQYLTAKGIVNEENVSTAKLLKAQVHATLAVAELVDALINTTVETRRSGRGTPK